MPSNTTTCQHCTFIGTSEHIGHSCIGHMDIIAKSEKPIESSGRMCNYIVFSRYDGYFLYTYHDFIPIRFCPICGRPLYIQNQA